MSFGIILENCKNNYNLGGAMRAAYNFNANFIATIGRRYKRNSLDTPNAGKHIPIFHFLNFAEYKKSATPWIHIGCEITSDSKNIVNFVHPRQAVYILGPEDGGLSKEAISMCKYIVQIPTNSCLNLAVCSAIIMYDRALKCST